MPFRKPVMNTFTKLGLIAIAPLLFSATVGTIPTAQAQSTLTQTQSNPRTVVDQFYRSYVSKKQVWKDLKDLIDPATYNQLSHVEMFDVEPFTDAQVRTWSYTIGTPRVKANIAEVPIRLMIGLRRSEAPRNLTIVLCRNSDRWQIRNVIYSSKPLPSGEPNDLLHLWKPKKAALSEAQVLDLINALSEVKQMRQAVENYQGEKLKLGISIDESATAVNPVATVGVYGYHTDHRTTLQRFLVNAQTQEIQVVDRVNGRSI